MLLNDFAQGLYGFWKTWKVLKFYYGNFQDWKVLEKATAPESSGNLLNSTKNMKYRKAVRKINIEILVV